MKSKILLLSSVLVTGVNAQEADFELIVQGVHVRDSETALPVTLLNEEEVRATASVSLGDTLSMQPGMNNSSFGPAVGQPVIRGQQGRRVMSLTNGMPNADASGNSADHATTVEPMLATGVEILRGPSTLLYGGGAIGGVINVLDNRFANTLLEKPEFSIEGRHDSAADMDTFVGSLSVPAGDFVWHLDVTDREWNDLEIPGLAIHPDYLEDEDHDEDEEHHEEEVENSDGFIANSGGETQAATLGLSYVLDNGFLGFSFNQMTNEYGLPPGVHGHDDEEPEAEEENVFIDMERQRYDFIASLNDLTPMIESLDYRLSYTDYEHAEMEGPGVIGTQFSNESWQQRLQLTHPEINNWHGVFGLQHSDETFAAVGEESFIPETDISSLGIFAVEALHADAFTYEFGLRFNRDELETNSVGLPDRSFNTASYSGSVLWDANQQASLGLAYSHSERAPSTEELFSNFGLADVADCVIHFATGSCEIGDVNLNEEESDNLDVSLYLSLRDIDATITWFYNSFHDYIYQANTGVEVDEFPVRAYQNDGADFYGVEADMLFTINNDWSIRFFGDRVESKLDDNSFVPRMPPVRVGSELNFNTSALNASLSVIKAAGQDKPGSGEIATDGYTRWDLSANYEFDTGDNGELLLFSKLRNITDEEIRLSTSFLRGFAPESGRSLELGVRYSF
jgi:iron complex outermembrane receptor protein